MRSTDAVDDGKLSYALSIEKPLQRALGRAVERLSGQRRLERLYRSYHAAPPAHSDFWSEALRRMNVDIRFAGGGLAAIPREGPLIVVANHPFGAIDGIALAWAIGQVRDNVKLLAHEALARVPETRPHLFVVDFAGTREAERTNVRSRAAAADHLAAGGALVVFPSGTVMTTASAFARRALEAPWGPLTARLARRSQAHILPVFVSGQNGRLFQMASHLRHPGLAQTMRYALLFRETAQHIGKAVDLKFGEAIAPATWSGHDAAAVTAELRRQTMALGGEEALA